jgi:hypothetical protein
MHSLLGLVAVDDAARPAALSAIIRACAKTRLTEASLRPPLVPPP